MKKYVMAVSMLLLLIMVTACGNNQSIGKSEAESTSNNEKIAVQQEENNMVYTHIGSKTIEIELADNSSAQAFKKLLQDKDISVSMHDYGGFEKVGDLGVSLPRNDTHITTEPGDVILYQGNTITIYYNTNSWNFTRLGKVRNMSTEELKNVLNAGGDDIQAVFSLK